MDKIVKQCKEKYFELSLSKIHGIGIIALRMIPKDTFLFEYSNKTEYILYDDLYKNGVQKSVVKSLNKNYAHDKYGIELPENINSISYVNYINHSKNNNVKWLIIDDYSTKYYTNRKINKGEELCISYKNYCDSCIDFKIKK